MRHLTALAAVALLALAGCGGDQPGEGGVTSEEREQLDNAALMVDNQQTFDTSADSLRIDENAAGAGTDVNALGAAAANEANAQ